MGDIPHIQSGSLVNNYPAMSRAGNGLGRVDFGGLTLFGV